MSMNELQTPAGRQHKTDVMTMLFLCVCICIVVVCVD